MDGLDIKGILSYIVEGKNVDVEIIQKDVDLSDVSDQNMESLVAAIEKGETVPAEKQVVQTPAEKPTTPPVEEKPVVKESSPVTRPTTSSRIPSSQLIAVQDGLYFRVQIAATRRFRDANITYSGFGLSRPVKVEYQEGWYKYTIGSYTTYQQARDYKDSVIRQGLDGAFVVAYRNGLRIDIMDALQMSGGR
jgi:cell division protein FtsN